MEHIDAYVISARAHNHRYWLIRHLLHCLWEARLICNVHAKSYFLKQYFIPMRPKLLLEKRSWFWPPQIHERMWYSSVSHRFGSIRSRIVNLSLKKIRHLDLGTELKHRFSWNWYTTPHYTHLNTQTQSQMGCRGYRDLKFYHTQQADTLACHLSMDAGRRQETTGSETLITATAVARGLAFVPTAQGSVPTGHCEGGDTHGGLHYSRRTPSLGNPNHFFQIFVLSRNKHNIKIYHFN